MSATDDADRLCQQLAGAPTVERLDEALGVLRTLRAQREFERLIELAEAVLRHRPDAGRVRSWQAQALIETGRLSIAVPLLQRAREVWGADPALLDEFDGQLGRAHKQLLMDTPDPDGRLSQGWLDEAQRCYAAPYRRDPVKNVWQGINLAALARAAERRALATAQAAAELAAEVLAELERNDTRARDAWWHATRAEALAALGRWAEADAALFAYLGHGDTDAFMVHGTLRQWRDVWQFQQQLPEGARLVQMLEAQLLRWPAPSGVALRLGAAHLEHMRALDPAPPTQSRGGAKGRETIDFYRVGLQRAAAVASVTEYLGTRFGTGFAVRAGDLGVQPADAVLLLTNHHVLNSSGRGPGGGFADVVVTFEAADGGPRTFGVAAVVAESPLANGLDYALLRLQGDAVPPTPLPLLRDVAAPDSRARIYVIGHPLGQLLQFSLHDNHLIDHECPPTGRPALPQRRLLQYSASTEEGSSGSPVFDDRWRCIGLHHAGGKVDPARNRNGIAPLNGGLTYVTANQGIWIGSIIDDVRSRAICLN